MRLRRLTWPLAAEVVRLTKWLERQGGAAEGEAVMGRRRDRVCDLTPCRRCGDVVSKKTGAWFCSLCRKWFCVSCGRNDHWWQCPRNAEAMIGRAMDNPDDDNPDRDPPGLEQNTMAWAAAWKWDRYARPARVRAWWGRAATRAKPEPRARAVGRWK